ncbi:MAG: DNA alkylation repair protein [Clostridia bacterium]|nr:DNA alkylation repair protein [Clostridia bacterium]
MENKITELLLNNKDEKYRVFHSKLMPTVSPDVIIGVRIPILRKLAKELYGTTEASDFLKQLPHRYYEENNLHAFLIEQIKDFDLCLEAVNRFLPYIDNWATCDSFSPAVFKKHPDKVLTEAYKWMNSEKLYTKRYGIGIMMKYFLDEGFSKDHLSFISKIDSDEYYVNMMISWYFATALAKRYNETVPYFENRILKEWIHKKSIQKAVESYRISPETKKYLRSLK